MKAIYLASILLCLTFNSNSQEGGANEGHGGIERMQHDQMSEFDRQTYWHINKQNQRSLMRQGKLTLNRGQAPTFVFPLKDSSNDPGYYGISNFVDLNASFPDDLQDFNCGDRTYDTTNGYNHQGIDLFPWPFGWHKMDQSQVTIHAVADGVITSKFDGNFDRQCSFGSGNWNAVYVTHADGSVVWYGHMKNGSVTSKNIGDAVVAGEYLGVVGSSGNSTGPHLHLETYDSNDQLIEPFAGACNTFNNESWWQQQLPYYDSKVVKLATHSVAPAFPSCPDTVDDPQFSNHFSGGDEVFFATYYQDQLQGQLTNLRIMRPDGSVFQSWTNSSNAPHYSGSFWWRSYILPNNPQQGRWIYETSYQGVTNQHAFFVGEVIFNNGFE